jgi:hypothetical protein
MSTQTTGVIPENGSSLVRARYVILRKSMSPAGSHDTTAFMPANGIYDGVICLLNAYQGACYTGRSSVCAHLSRCE